MNDPKIIVTHSSPDFDAIGYAWLMKRFAPGFEDAKIILMPLNAIDKAVLEAADSVGDMGEVYDLNTLRFDHHQLPGKESTSTCAAVLAWKWLDYEEGLNVRHLKPLVITILEGDQGLTPQVGLHSILWGAGLQKNPLTGQRMSDQEMLAIGFQLLDRAAAWLLHKAEAAAELEDKVIWKSGDGAIWAIKGGKNSTSFAAYDQGAKVVVYESEPFEVNGSLTYPVGMSRSPHCTAPHLGEIAERIIKRSFYDELESVCKEMETWYRHQDGFYAGRGSKAAPCPDPFEADLVLIAKEVDRAWSWRHV